MNFRLLALGLGLLLAGCGKTEPGVTLVAFAEDCHRDTPLDTSKVVDVVVPKALATSDALSPEALKAHLGSRLRVEVSKGDLLVSSQLGRDERFSERVQKKGRAVTLAVSGGADLKASDRVELLAATRSLESEDWQAVTLLENVGIVALGPAPKDAENLRNVSFVVLPEEAEVASLTSRLGAVHAVAREPAATLATRRTAALETLRARILAGRTGPYAPAATPSTKLLPPPPPGAEP